MPYPFQTVEWYDFFEEEIAPASPDTELERRRHFRKKLVLGFMAEEAGRGKRELASRYHYHVETTLHGTEIYLGRPASLNKGIDFTVNYTTYRCPSKGGKRLVNGPSHQFVVNCLAEIEENQPELMPYVETMLRRYYRCLPGGQWRHESDSEYSKLAEIVCKSVRWLFMEQDLAYWNYSGREMLYHAMRHSGVDL